MENEDFIYEIKTDDNGANYVSISGFYMQGCLDDYYNFHPEVEYETICLPSHINGLPVTELDDFDYTFKLNFGDEEDLQYIGDFSRYTECVELFMVVLRF